MEQSQSPSLHTHAAQSLVSVLRRSYKFPFPRGTSTGEARTVWCLRTTEKLLKDSSVLQRVSVRT